MGFVLNRVIALAPVLCAAWLPGAHAADWIQPPDWELDADVRLVSSDGKASFSNGGLGTLRYDHTESGLRLGRARLALSEPLGDVWSVKLDASAWGDHEGPAVDLTEAYVQFRPYPVAGYRLRVKAGAFHSPISLENRAGGWESPYTLSYSAINTWLAEELRTVGVESQLDWLGRHDGHSLDLALVGAAFGWNDPAGIVLATRGFSVSDRQTTLFGQVGAPGSSPLQPLELFHEIDDRPGYYAGLEAKYLDRLVIRALHYDNPGDPEAFDTVIRAHAWQTRFNSVGVRMESAAGWTAIAQWLGGETYVEPSGEDDVYGWPFRARFLLLSRQLRNHRLSIRYDSFAVDSESDEGDGAQHGHAWTAAYSYEAGGCWRFTLEWLHVRSASANRALELGVAPLATETEIQLAVRVALGTLAR